MDTVLKYPGSKWSIANWIVNHFPPHKAYLEPFFGGGSVFFTKKPVKLETINDLDGNVVNLFKVIRERPREFAEMIWFTPWARAEYTAILPELGVMEPFVRTGDSLEDARRFLVRMWMAYGAKTSDRSGWRNDISGRGQGTCLPRLWKSLPARIVEISERLLDAQIECMEAVPLIERHNSPDVLIYADPPYPLSTRASRMYAHEMTEMDHRELLEALDKHPGPVLLSGYANPLYDERLRHWARDTIRVVAEGGRVRTEVLWVNPVATERSLGQGRLFG